MQIDVYAKWINWTFPIQRKMYLWRIWLARVSLCGLENERTDLMMIMMFIMRDQCGNLTFSTLICFEPTSDNARQAHVCITLCLSVCQCWSHKQKKLLCIFCSNGLVVRLFLCHSWTWALYQCQDVYIISVIVLARRVSFLYPDLI